MSRFILQQDGPSLHDVEVRYSNSFSVTDLERGNRRVAAQHDSLALDDSDQFRVAAPHTRKKKRSRHTESANLAHGTPLAAQQAVAKTAATKPAHKKKKRVERAPPAVIPVRAPVVEMAVSEGRKRKKRRTKRESDHDQPEIELGTDEPMIELGRQAAPRRRKKVHKVMRTQPLLPQRQSTPALQAGIPAHRSGSAQPTDQPQIDVSLIERTPVAPVHIQHKKAVGDGTTSSAAHFFQKERSPSIFYDYMLQQSNSNQQQQNQIQQLQNQLQRMQTDLELEKQKNALYQKQQENKEQLNSSFIKRQVQEELDDQRALRIGNETNQLFDMLMKQIKYEVDEIKKQRSVTESMSASATEQQATGGASAMQRQDNAREPRSEPEQNHNDGNIKHNDSVVNISLAETSPVRRDLKQKQAQIKEQLEDIRQKGRIQTRKQKLLFKLQQLIQKQQQDGGSSAYFDQTDLEALDVLPEEQIEEFINQFTNRQQASTRKQEQVSFNGQINELKAMVLEMNKNQQEEQRMQLNLLQQTIKTSIEAVRAQLEEAVRKGYPEPRFQARPIAQPPVANPYIQPIDYNSAINVVARAAYRRQRAGDDPLRFLFADMALPHGK